MKKTGRFEKRRASRVAGVQAIYQLHYHKTIFGDGPGSGATAIVSEFLNNPRDGEEGVGPMDADLFSTLVKESDIRMADVDHLIEINLGPTWSFDRMDLVLKAILRCAVTEFLARPTQTAGPVLIGEYVDITQGFYDGQESSYVNGFLDRIAVSLGYAMVRP